MFGKHEELLNYELWKLSLKYKDKMSVLDLGCYDGKKTLLFATFSHRKLLGIDCLDKMTDETKSHISFYKTDFIENAIQVDKKMDIVFSFDVIEHLPKTGRFFQNVRDNLKDDGVFIIGTPNRVRLGTLGLRKFPYNPDGHTDKYASHLIEYDVKQLSRLLRHNGFKVIKTHKIFYGITGSYGFDRLFGLPLFHHIIMECVHADKRKVGCGSCDCDRVTGGLSDQGLPRPLPSVS